MRGLRFHPERYSSDWEGRKTLQGPFLEQGEASLRGDVLPQDPMQRNVSDESVADQHGGHDEHIQPQIAEPHGFDGRKISDPAKLPFRALVHVVVAVLDPEKEPVTVVAVAQVLEPLYERGYLLNVVPTRDQEHESRDRGQCRGLLYVHEDGAERQSKGLRHQDAVEDNEQWEDKSGRVGLEPAHPVDDEDECGWEGKLKRQVTDGPGKEVGREPVHSWRPFFHEYSSFLRECEDCIVEWIEAPEHREEEEQGDLQSSKQNYFSSGQFALILFCLEMLLDSIYQGEIKLYFAIQFLVLQIESSWYEVFFSPQGVLFII